MAVPSWVWAITVAVVVGLLVLDFLGHVRTPHAPSLHTNGQLIGAAHLPVASHVSAVLPSGLQRLASGEHSPPHAPFAHTNGQS